MMANFTLKKVPDDLYERLKASARLHRRSINAEAIVCLERSLQHERLDTALFLDRARRHRRNAPEVFVTDRDLELAKREGRP